MKIKDGFILKAVAGNYVVIALEESLDFNKVITVNEVGALIWEKLNDGMERKDIISHIAKEYNVDEETVSADFDEFILSLRESNIIED